MTFEEAFDPIRSLKASWSALKIAPAPMWVGGILMFVLDGGGGGGGFNPGGMQNRQDMEEILPVIIAVGGLACCMGLVFWVLASWIWIGFANSVEEVLRTGTGDVGRVFESKGRLVTMMLARLLAGLLAVLSLVPMVIAVGAAAFLGAEEILPEVAAIGMGVAGGIVGFLVFIYVALGLVFVPQVVALEGLDVVESISRSWSLAQSRRLRLFFYYFVIYVFMLLGFCLCCIGVFATGALFSISRVESYLAFTRSNDLPGWWITTGQPHVAPAGSWGASSPPPIPQ
jgi:hypothetical protein